MPSKLTKEQAKQILDALNREEQKLKGKKEKGQSWQFSIGKRLVKSMNIFYF